MSPISSIIERVISKVRIKYTTFKMWNALAKSGIVETFCDNH